MESMHVLAISGLIGSGKDTVAKYISDEYGYEIIQFADVLRGMLKKEGIELTRENLQKYRMKHGRTFLAEECLDVALSMKKEKMIFIPLRMYEDYSVLKKHFSSMKLIWIDAPVKERFGRLKTRQRENDPKSAESFKSQDTSEKDLFDFDRLEKMADYRISNNGNIMDLKKSIDRMMKEVKE